jgi:hypothetical protein
MAPSVDGLSLKIVIPLVEKPPKKPEKAILFNLIKQVIT